MKSTVLAIVFVVAACVATSCQRAPEVVRAPAVDPLPSWNDTAPKRAVVDFVARVTTAGSPDYVAPEARIATFDNDGTLWVEQPMYFQLAFALDRVKALAPQHPEWATKEPFASLLRGDLAGALAGGEKGLMEIVMVTHSGMTTDEFEQTVIEVAGHTDNTGSDQYNQQLSERRANAVAAYLKTRDVRPDRIITVGAGETHPVASNDTPDGRQRNRRVELTLVPLTVKS